ncbi:hypothetical protein E2C01_014796 [Portunus trituberculatus]|uniref:Uncharacterized protein n=1 Tax=Portunus trituberculatus TaxID=210409 RepID=A0A5B7DK52_PORTR|nr:hypothetical protein [Portunus trituberculatus]
MLFYGHCSQAEAEKVLNQITKRTNRGLCKLTKNASSSNVIDLAQDLSSSEDEKRGGGLSSRLDYIPVKRGSIAAASDDSQNADDSVDGEEDATK